MFKENKYIYRIAILIMLLISIEGQAQPGSYTSIINFTIIDTATNCIKSNYSINFSDSSSVITDYKPYSESLTVLNGHLTIKASYIWSLYYPILQITKTNADGHIDIMSIKIFLSGTYEGSWLIDSVPFLKGVFYLSNSMFKYNYEKHIDKFYLENLDFAKPLIDKNGNFIILDYWNWDIKNIKHKELYNKDWILLQTEYWNKKGLLMSSNDIVNNIKQSWFDNGSLRIYESPSEFLSKDINGNIIAHKKYNIETEEWEEF